MKKLSVIILSVVLLAAAIQVKAQTPTVKASLNNLVTAYLDLKNSLAADNGVDAEGKAKIFNSKVAGVPVESMTGNEVTIWKRYVDKLSFDSRHISETTAIDHQREHFASLSKNMYEVLKSYKANSAVLYWQYCPMKKMSWLSEKSAIENPYYGKAMLDCGSVKETLKAAK